MDDILVFVLLLILLNIAVSFCDAGKKSFMIYPRSNEANITCNGSDVINITRTELYHNPTHCDVNECNLSKDDKSYMFDNCNGNSSCEVSPSHMSPCISMIGFINVNYACQSHVHSCNFERDNCGWKPYNTADWIRYRGNSYFDIPSKDHTTGSDSGHFMYSYSGDRHRYFISNKIKHNSIQCITFWFWVFHKKINDPMTLQRYIQVKSQYKKIDEWIVKYKHSGNHLWEKMVIQLKDVGDYWLRFDAYGSYENSRFAIDDILILNIGCEELNDAECDFQTGLCEWSSPAGWKRQQSETKSSYYTGPLTDHSSTSASGYYVYMETSNLSEGTKYNLSSPIFNTTGDVCFSFWYNMYGSHMGSLTVYRKTDKGHSRKLFSKHGNQGQLWHLERLDLRLVDNFQLIFEGERGSGHRSDIAIDDVSLLPGTCEGLIKHEEKCNDIKDGILLPGCHHYYLPLETVRFESDQNPENCNNITDVIRADEVCNTSNYYIYCDLRSIFLHPPSCLHVNNLTVEYTCEETANIKPVSQKERGNGSMSTGMVAGIISGVLSMVCLTFTVLFIIYRRRRQPSKLQSTTINECTVSWDSDNQSIATNLTNMMTAHSSDKSSNNVVHSDMQHNLATSNPSYTQECDYTSSAHGRDVEYMNMPNHKNKNSKNHVFGSEYTVLDPTKNEYDRTNQDVYELASAITETVEDDYAESESGQYDISGNSRHRMTDTIYDHSIDGIYDSSQRGRQLSTGDDTYDHTFGKHTGDEYDIAQS